MSAKNVFLLYPAWVLISLVFYLLVRNLPESGALEYVSIIGMLLFMSGITRWHLVRIEPALGETRFIRWLLVLVQLLLLVAGYLLAAAGITGNLFTAILTANLVLFACIFGNALAGALKRPAEIIPVCCILAVCDAFSVFAGPTRYFAGTLSEYYTGGMAGAPPLVDFFLVKFPLPGSEIFMPVFGITDWIAVVLLSAAARKFDMNDNLLAGTKSRFLFFPLGALGLLLSIVAARETGIYLPALPLIAGIFLTVMMIKYPEARRLSMAEIKPMSIIFAGLIFMIIIFQISGK